MSEHFFYVAKQKHARLFRWLVALNTALTVALVCLCNSYSHKVFLREKQHVLASYLGVPDVKAHNKLDTFAAFYAFFSNALIVSLAEPQEHTRRVRD